MKKQTISTTVTVFLLTLIVITTAFMPGRKTRVIFFGDSITEMGNWSGGYIDIIRSKIKNSQLENKYKLLGAGIGGNKVYDLYLRMEDDVLAKKPDIVVIYIGINDVWHKKTLGTGTDIDKFEKFYRAIIKKMQAKKIKLFICTPSVIGELKDGQNLLDEELDKYAEVIRKIAAAENCTLIDLRKVFTTYEAENNTGNLEAGILTTDKVHLNNTGNQLVAKTFTAALGIK